MIIKFDDLSNLEKSKCFDAKSRERGQYEIAAWFAGEIRTMEMIRSWWLRLRMRRGLE